MLRPFVTLLLSLSLLLAAAGAPATAQQRTGERPSRSARTLPQGTSRLSDEQRLRAAAIAEKSIEAAGMRTDERLYLVSVHWFHDKQSSDLKSLVTHYRTDGDLTIVHRVNLTTGEIEQVQQTVDRPTSLSREEFEIARGLAFADERVAAAIGKRPDLIIEPMVVRGGTKDAAGRGHRLVRLLFKDGSDYLTRPVVFVDLTAETVMIEQVDPDAPR